MGLDHREKGGTRRPPPTEFGVGGTLRQIVPPQISSYRYKNERYVAFKIRQNPFSAGALPLGELTTLPRPLI